MKALYKVFLKYFWYCFTGAIIIGGATYYFSVARDLQGQDLENAVQNEVVEIVKKHGTIAETVGNKIERKEVRAKEAKKVEPPLPTMWKDNPVYAAIMREMGALSDECLELIDKGYRARKLSDGYYLLEQEGRPLVDMPKEAAITIAGRTFGEVDKAAAPTGTDEIKCMSYRKLETPAFYCTETETRVLPATSQIVGMKMNGKFIAENTIVLGHVVDEIESAFADSWDKVYVEHKSGDMDNSYIRTYTINGDTEVRLKISRPDSQHEHKISLEFTNSKLKEDLREQESRLSSAATKASDEYYKQSGERVHSSTQKIIDKEATNAARTELGFTDKLIQ